MWYRESVHTLSFKNINYKLIQTRVPEALDKGHQIHLIKSVNTILY